MSIFSSFQKKKKVSEHSGASHNSRKTQKGYSEIQLNQLDTAFFERLRKKLSDYHIAKIKPPMNEEECLCPKCKRDLIKVDNMVIVQNQKETLGINGHFCPSCKTIYINEEEIIDIRKRIRFADGSKFKAFILSNSDHNTEDRIIEDALHMEAIMRNVLDKMNETVDPEGYKIYKSNNPPSVCPVCTKKRFKHSNEAITVYRNDDAEEYIFEGDYCDDCKVIYITEDALYERINEGIDTTNILETIINVKQAEIDPFIKQLEMELSDGKTLYIHKGNIVCERSGHSIISVTAELPSLSSGSTVQININYCKTCGKCFINDIVYEHYKNEGILPAIKLVRTKKDGTYPSEHEVDLAPESPLHLMGYNVSQRDDYSDAYRQQLLGRIMDSGALSKHEIENYLSIFIRKSLPQKNKRVAVSKWERDLKYVEKYNIHKQKKVKITSIKPYK